MAKTRKFDGKVYELYDWESFKKEAVKEASRLRKQGKRVRLTRGLEGYLVWVR